jgi:hypothetical protein
MRAIAMLAVTLLASCHSSFEGGDDAAADTVLDAGDDAAADTATDGGGGPGECAGDGDCPSGRCVRVPDEPGGYWLCEDTGWEEATECSSPYPGADECCDASDCDPGGTCYHVEAPWGSCGGAMPMPHNMCVFDECASEADCPDPDAAICLPRWVLGWPRSRCVTGTCRTALACGAGYCAPLADPCCSWNIQGFFCIQPGACASSEGCAPGASCMGDWDTGGTRCDAFVPCPA